MPTVPTELQYSWNQLNQRAESLLLSVQGYRQRTYGQVRAKTEKITQLPDFELTENALIARDQQAEETGGQS